MEKDPTSSNLITMITTFGKTVDIVMTGSYHSQSWAAFNYRFLACKFYQTLINHIKIYTYLTLSNYY